MQGSGELGTDIGVDLAFRGDDVDALVDAVFDAEPVARAGLVDGGPRLFGFIDLLTVALPWDARGAGRFCPTARSARVGGF
ncbi:hypothetical protein ACFYXC_40255 [Streptomyces sp. NPDC002701]|uniref:hypothetical protein n=1 Tax=Streptomyces sp. NPDC002701 TaxID=3364661 RepID=UPI00369C8153